MDTGSSVTSFRSTCPKTQSPLDARWPALPATGSHRVRRRHRGPIAKENVAVTLEKPFFPPENDLGRMAAFDYDSLPSLPITASSCPRKTALSRYQINSLQPTGIIVHGLHKSGTMFLYQLFQRLARVRRIAFYSSNHSQPNDHLVTPDIDHDFCLCPVRSYGNLPSGWDGRIRIKRIFHVRDPRDTLVSQYYSYGWRHTAEGFNRGRQRQRESIRSMTIDQYVLNQQAVVRPLKRRYADLIHRQPYELRNVVHYEQMVLDFPGWLDKVLAPFEFRMPGLIKKRFAIRYRNEFQPDGDPAGHKRSVIPGDYLRRLRPETIEQLNELLQPELRALKYPVRQLPQAA
jgi:hypothetical protein